MNRINTIKPIRILKFLFLALFAISPLIPDGNKIIPRIDPSVQNILHVPVFALLSVLLFLIFSEFRMTVSKQILFIVLITQTLSILTEAIQLFIPGRMPSFGDMGYNFLGMLCGLFLVVCIKRIRSIILRFA